MRRALAICAAIGALTVATSAAVIPIVRSGDVIVTATYKGKGPVDEKHKILVFLFDHPMPTADSRPLGLQTVAKNGGSATFAAVGPSPVYVTVVYDEKSNYDGQNGPPPAGTPIGRPMKAGKPVPITPGPTAKVSVTFDDSQRWK
jgi:hypothetical protein